MTSEFWQGMRFKTQKRAFASFGFGFILSWSAISFAYKSPSLFLLIPGVAALFFWVDAWRILWPRYQAYRKDKGWRCRHHQCDQRIGLTDMAEAFRLGGALGNIPDELRAFVVCPRRHVSEIPWHVAWSEMIAHLSDLTASAKSAAKVQKNEKNAESQEKYVLNTKFADKSSALLEEALALEYTYTDRKQLRARLRPYAGRRWPRSRRLRDSLYDLLAMLWSFDQAQLSAEILMAQDLNYRLLRRLYHVTGGARQRVFFPEAAAEEGLNNNDAIGVLNYLIDNGLVTLETDDGWVRLTERGVAEIEHAEDFPNEPTEHFPTQVIQQNIFNAPVANVQGPQSHAQVYQNAGTDISQVLREVEKIRQRIWQIPLEDSAQAAQLVEELEQHVQSPKPPLRSIKAVLKELVETTRDIAVEVAAAAISKSLGIS